MRGEMAAATNFYAQAALKEPTDPLLRLLTGIALSSLEEPSARKRALTQFQAAARLSGDDLLATLLLRGALADSGAMEEAQSVWLDAARRYGRSGKSGWDTSRSLTRLQDALKLFPQSPILHLLVGDAYQVAEEFAKADTAYERAILLAPRWTKPRINRGLCQLAQNHLKEAEETFTKVLSLDPRNAQAQLSKADTQLQSGNAADAVLTYRVAANSRQINIRPQALTGMGQAFLQQRRPLEAVKTLTTAQRLAPNDPAPPTALAEAQVQMGDYAAGAKSLEVALRLTKDGGLFETRAVLFRALIETRMSAKEPMEALKSAQRAMIEEPANAPLWERLSAHIYFEMGNEKEGHNALHRALDSWVGLPNTAPLYPQEIINALSAHSLMDTAETWYQVQMADKTLSADVRANAKVALAHLARYRGDTSVEVRLRAEATELREKGADWYLLAETHDLRRTDIPQARFAYEKALRLGGLPDGVVSAVRKRLRLLSRVP